MDLIELKKYPLILILTIILLSGAVVTYAIDEEGCLTCHQYPGLVSLEEANRLRILHIDEEKYLRSSHGGLKCRECHTHIDKVPHTGSLTVSCAEDCHHTEKIMKAYDTTADCSKCHTEYPDKVKRISFYLSSFHEKEQSAVIELYNKSSCRVCHSLYPHSKDNHIRAFINMHASFMLCEVCHLRSDREGTFEICGTCHVQRKNLTYDWYRPEKAVFSGEPYGYYTKNKAKPEKSILDTGKELISETLMLQEDVPEEQIWTEYSIMRLATYTDGKAHKKLLMNTWDTEKAIKFNARRQRLSSASIQRQLKYFHRDMSKKNISITCVECHSNESVLDYQKLGFDRLKEYKLKNLNINGLVMHYETFYFPKLLDKHK